MWAWPNKVTRNKTFVCCEYLAITTGLGAHFVSLFRYCMAGYLRNIPSIALMFLEELLFTILHRSNKLDLVGLYFVLLSCMFLLSEWNVTGQNA